MSETLQENQEKQLEDIKQEYLDALTQQWLATKKDLTELQGSIVSGNDELTDLISDTGIVEETLGLIPQYLLDSYISGGFFAGILSPLMLKKFFDDKQLWHIKEFRKEFVSLRKKLWKDSFSQGLQQLQEKHFNGNDFIYGEDIEVDVTDFVLDESILSQEEYDDKEPREKVIAAIDEITTINQKTPIKYKMWSRKIQWKNPTIDCSWLVSTVLDKAWFAIGDQTSRSLFKKFETKQFSAKVDNSIKVQKSVLDKTSPGDIVYWDAKNPAYKWSSWDIPSLKKWEKEYRIHHVAVVTEVFSDGRLRIFESNGKDGVTERILDPKTELTSKSKSELYISHMRYDALPVKESQTA